MGEQEISVRGASERFFWTFPEAIELAASVLSEEPSHKWEAL